MVISAIYVLLRNLALEHLFGHGSSLQHATVLMYVAFSVFYRVYRVQTETVADSCFLLIAVSSYLFSGIIKINSNFVI